MKPAWDQLMNEYKGHDSILVADVDCIGDGKPLCETHGVQGFPSIKYGDPNNLEEYEGERDFDALQTFAKENLGPTCGPKNIDLCDEEKTALIKKFMAMSTADLRAEIKKKDDESSKIDSDFDEFVKGLESQYEAAQKKKDDKKKAIKESGLGLMKSVKASKKEEL